VEICKKGKGEEGGEIVDEKKTTISCRCPEGNLDDATEGENQKSAL